MKASASSVPRSVWRRLSNLPRLRRAHTGVSARVDAEAVSILPGTQKRSVEVALPSVSLFLPSASLIPTHPDPQALSASSARAFMALCGQTLQRAGKLNFFCNCVSHRQWEQVSQGHVALETDGVSGARVEHGYLNFLSRDSQATLTFPIFESLWKQGLEVSGCGPWIWRLTRW